MYTAFARNSVMGADPDWTREVFGMALVPDLVLYLDIDVEIAHPARHHGQGNGLLGIRDAISRSAPTCSIPSNATRGRLIDEYRRLSSEFGFISVDARLPIEELQTELRNTSLNICPAPTASRATTTAHQAPRNSNGGRCLALRSAASRVTLSPGETVADAARKAIAFGAESLLRNQKCGRSGDAEPLHQLRVATRRLRASIELFSSVIYARAAQNLPARPPVDGRQWPAAPANAT